MNSNGGRRMSTFGTSCRVLFETRPIQGVQTGMELMVDLSSGTVALLDGNEMEHFSLQVVRQNAMDGSENGALGALAAALSVHDAGTVEPTGDVLVPVAAVRRLAGEAASSQGRTLDSKWETGFAGMLDHAAANGWMDDDGSIRAHVEWRD
jgi:hypothetical protein